MIFWYNDCLIITKYWWVLHMYNDLRQLTVSLKKTYTKVTKDNNDYSMNIIALHEYKLKHYNFYRQQFEVYNFCITLYIILHNSKMRKKHIYFELHFIISCVELWKVCNRREKVFDIFKLITRYHSIKGH